MTPPAKDPNLRRLARALFLDCKREGPGLYAVWGGARPHQVRLGKNNHCDCVDFGMNGGFCKHIARALLARGDQRVVRALRLLVPYPGKRVRGNV